MRSKFALWGHGYPDHRSTAKGKDKDGAIDEQHRWTRVFVRKNGQWQLVHSQGTTVQKP